MFIGRNNLKNENQSEEIAIVENFNKGKGSKMNQKEGCINE
jgi:hypothetical protein